MNTNTHDVLLVSDCETETRTASALLAGLGYGVLPARSPEEAAIYCRAHSLVAVIADIETAGGNGFESIAAVRRTNRDAYIIATTRGDHQELWPAVADVCGANTYVCGPLTAEKLKNVLSGGVSRAALN